MSLSSRGEDCRGLGLRAKIKSAEMCIRDRNHSVAPRTPGASRKKRPKTSGGTARHVSPRMPAAESNRKMSLLVYAAEILLLFAVIALVVRFIPDFSKKGAGESTYESSEEQTKEKENPKESSAAQDASKPDEDSGGDAALDGAKIQKAKRPSRPVTEESEPAEEEKPYVCLLYTSCTIEHNEEMIRMLYDYDVRLHLSGHLHLQHYKEDEDNGISEIVTGSLVMAPCHYGVRCV